jgi:hypothetical protein
MEGIYSFINLELYYHSFCYTFIARYLALHQLVSSSYLLSLCLNLGYLNRLFALNIPTSFNKRFHLDEIVKRPMFTE